MKLNIKYLSFLLAGAAMFASCDKNEPNVFNDNDAFVAFDAVSVSYNEDYSKDSTMTFRIPVTLASATGLEETVKFEIVAPEDSTKAAKAGVNYELVTTTGVLSFNAENRTQYIEFLTMPDGEYTGDLKFTVKLLASETLAADVDSMMALVAESNNTISGSSYEKYPALIDRLTAIIATVKAGYTIPTGIDGIIFDEKNAVIYDSRGRRIDKITSPGIYIVDGKKVYVSK